MARKKKELSIQEQIDRNTARTAAARKAKQIRLEEQIEQLKEKHRQEDEELVAQEKTDNEALQAQLDPYVEYIKQAETISRTINTQLDKLQNNYLKAIEDTGRELEWLELQGVLMPSTMLRGILDKWKRTDAAQESRLKERAAQEPATTEPETQTTQKDMQEPTVEDAGQYQTEQNVYGQQEGQYQQYDGQEHRQEEYPQGY